MTQLHVGCWSRPIQRLAYIALDATPRVVPVGFYWNGVTLVIGTVPDSAKVAALEANPVVALTIDTNPPAWPPNVLLIRGRAELSTVDRSLPRVCARRVEADACQGTVGLPLAVAPVDRPAGDRSQYERAACAGRGRPRVRGGRGR